MGNPASSQCVDNLRQKYARICKDDGYKEISNVRLSEADFQAMISCLDQRVLELGQLQAATTISRMQDVYQLERGTGAAAFTVL